jgi:alpha-mannosidase
LRVDPKTGGLASLIHVPSGQQLLVPGSARTIGQLVYHDGQEHPVKNLTSKLVTTGPVLARLSIVGTTADIRHETLVTIYADLDRVDFDCRIEKPVSTREQRLCHVFPVLRPDAVVRAETTGVVIRPYAQPKGDLLPGADPRRFAVQGFVDASVDGGLGVTIVPVEAFALRMDLDPLSFEALGNDQNYQESTRDQNGETQFRFRYSLRAHTNGWQGAAAAAFSSSVTSPPIVCAGSVATRDLRVPAVDANRALVTAFKPADDPKSGGHILRLWERAGAGGPLKIAVPGYARAVQTDLLERDQRDLPIQNGEVAIQLAAHGFGAIRLLPA